MPVKLLPVNKLISASPPTINDETLQLYEEALSHDVTEVHVDGIQNPMAFIHAKRDSSLENSIDLMTWHSILAFSRRSVMRSGSWMEVRRCATLAAGVG